MTRLSYAAAGVNYIKLDRAKTAAQRAARATAKGLLAQGYKEVDATRGESAYVWQQGNIYMASVIEGLGTKNLVADAMRKITGKTYYDQLALDTVATIVNDLATVGASPLVLHAYWALGKSDWLADEKRTSDLIRGWKKGAMLAGVAWGGGETPSNTGIINPDTIDLAGSAVGIIQKKSHLLLDTNIQAGDRILFLKSTGINANGLTLARALAKKLPQGYATKLPNGTMYGEALLRPANVYARLVTDLLRSGVKLHYITNITGHGLRKIMRARRPYTYIIEELFAPPAIFPFIQVHGELTDTDMYETFNMGQDYALFLPEKEVAKSKKIIRAHGFQSLDAGHIEKGKKQVVIQPKNITYREESLQVR